MKSNNDVFAETKKMNSQYKLESSEKHHEGHDSNVSLTTTDIIAIKHENNYESD